MRSILRMAGFAAAVAGLGAFAQDVAAPEAAEGSADVQGANEELAVRVSAKDKLSEAFAEFAAELHFDYGAMTPTGKLYSKGQAAVAAGLESPDFIKSCAMAYERAYLDALSQFIMDFYGHQTTKQIYDYYNDASSDVLEPPPAEARTVCEKVKLLTEAKLDKALREEGVPMEKYAGASIVAKRQLFLEQIGKKIANVAVHSSSGCMPVKTFVASGDDGRYYVGVVVRYDESCRELARCFRQKRRPGVRRDGGLTLKDALPPKDEMYSNFGARLYIDETGYPSLLSFGQYGVSYPGRNPRAADRAEDAAIRQARNLADSALTMFINSTLRVTEDSEMGEGESEDIVFTEDGAPSYDSVMKTIDRQRRGIEQVGSDTLKGRSTVFSEILTHPNGHKLAVVVRRWSFDTVDAIDRMDAKKPAERERQHVPARPNPGAQIHKGHTYDF